MGFFMLARGCASSCIARPTVTRTRDGQKKRMKRNRQLGIVSIVVWLALLSNVSADTSITPVEGSEPPVVGASLQASAQVQDDDATSVQPPERTVLRPAPNAVFLEGLGGRRRLFREL